jgi:protein TonB
MRKDLLGWAIPGSIVVNLFLIGLVPLLSTERGLSQDMTEPVGISLVQLAPPEPPKDKATETRKKPKPQEKMDFTPDLVRPNLNLQGASDIGGVAIDLGSLGGATDLGAELVFEAYELDQPPQAIVRVPPVYPYKAREQGIEGVVQVKVLVLADGSVGQVLVLDARPKGLFEDAVRKAVPQWKFSAGKVEGEPVTAWVVTAVRFEL